MPAGANTWALHETLIGSRALPPPPMRHALLAFIIALAAVILLGTAGWSEIQNGLEGEIASGARQMLQDGSSFTPVRDGVASPTTPPLTYWFIAAAYKLFGVTPFAARLPTAISTIGALTLTFLIGERLGGYWRGFIAALLQLCSLTTFIWGRTATPQAFTLVFIEGAIFCAIAGHAQRRGRPWWFAAVSGFAALAFLAGGTPSLLVLATIFVALAFTFRETRMRFRELLRWPQLVVFGAIVAPWLAFVFSHLQRPQPNIRWLDVLSPFAAIEPVSISAREHVFGSVDVAITWAPVILLVLPAVVFASRRIIRPREFDFADALPVYWFAATALRLLFTNRPDVYDSLGLLPPFALWSACIWDRAPRPMRLVGVALAALGYAGVAMLMRHADPPWPSPGGRHGAFLPSILPLVAFALAFSAVLLAAYLTSRNREKLGVTMLLLAAVPLGLDAAEALALRGASLSFAGAAYFLQPRLGETGELMVEASPRAASSLAFYLDRPPTYIGANAPTQKRIVISEAIDRFAGDTPVYLLVHKNEIGRWQEALTARYHLYHQVSTCGDYVIVVNQP